MYQVKLNIDKLQLSTYSEQSETVYWLHPSDSPIKEFEVHSVRLYHTQTGFCSGKLIQTKQHTWLQLDSTVSDDANCAALASCWVHAYNNLISTISGYAELLQLESPHPFLEHIVARVESIQAFNQQASLLSGKRELGKGSCNLADLTLPGCKHNTNCELAVDSDIVEQVVATLNEFSSTIMEQEPNITAQPIHISPLNQGYLILRWQFNQEVPINNWSVASIYQALRSRCGYQLQFDLIVLPYLLSLCGGRLISDSYGSEASFIDIGLPCSGELVANKLDSTKYVLIESDDNWCVSMAEWLWQCGVQVWCCQSATELKQAQLALFGQDAEVLILARGEKVIAQRDYLGLLEKISTHFS